jgi:hypothetical protein
MARLRELLAYARLNDRRSALHSGSFRAFTLLVGAGSAFGFVSQLKRVLFGPVALRLQSAEYLIFAVSALWLLVPLSARPSIPASSLHIYPITDRQRLIYRLLSHLQNTQAVVIVIASLLSILALIHVPEPALRMAQAATCFIVAASAGVALSSAFIKLTTIQSNFRRTRERKSLQSLAHPLFRKEVSYFARTLDPYLGLIISAGFGYSEYLASWLTPAKATLPMLLVTAVQLSAVANPFALDSAAEMDRYRLMPLPPWKISARKHLALITILLLTMSPLIAATFMRMTLQHDLATLVELCIILASWLCAGVILMRLDESSTIQMSFGSLSGTGFSLGLFGLAVVILVSAPLANAFVLRSGSSPLAVLLSVGLLCVPCFAYAIGLRSSSKTRLRLN